MDPDNQSKPDDFGAAMPLPDEAAPAAPKKADQPNLAADLVRKKVQAAYAAAPDAATEAIEVAEQGPNAPRSRHQEFIYNLTSSGKSMEEIQVEWHDYYAGLTDVDKHQVWQEFYKAHDASSKLAPQPAQTAPAAPEVKKPTKAAAPAMRTMADLQKHVVGGTRTGRRRKLKAKEHLKSLLFGLASGALVILILLFSFFNERFIAPFIQPSRNLTNTQIISGQANVGPDPVIIIPKINLQVPIVYGINTINEAAIENGLNNGAVHYADTAQPGQDGNAVFVGHSSSNVLNNGKYKFAFVLLHRLDVNDTFFLQKDGKRYTYQIYKREIIKPTDVSVLQNTENLATATLITCDPPGTNVNRLVVIGKQISPDPATNSAAPTTTIASAQTALLPGNSISLWSRLTGWLSH